MAQARRPLAAAGAGDTANAGEGWGRAEDRAPRAGLSAAVPRSGGGSGRCHRGASSLAHTVGVERLRAAPQSNLLAAPLTDRGDRDAGLAGGAPRRLGPAGKPAPCAERTRAGLQLRGRPSSALPAPRCPRPVPARSLPCALCSLRPALLCSFT